MERATAHNYEKAFLEAFAEIDPNQNWGFNPMPICGDDIDLTRGSNTESNLWETLYHYEVPGGLSDNTAPWGWSAGDVTNYERAYVYWWFSTHLWPQTLSVNWSEFFIENVWGQPEHSGFTGDYQDPGYTGTIGCGMDALTILKEGKSPTNAPTNPNYITDITTAMTHAQDEPSSVFYEPINDYNSAGGEKEQVMYVHDVSTKDFFYKETRGQTKPFHNNWTIQYINGNYYLAFDYWCQKKDDNGFLQDDYSLIKPDGFYNDWILKISSGTHKVDAYTRRIMCEDLGTTFDWDFNDLVFDVTIYSGDYGNGNSGYYAQITLQAAGGTLPIYIGQKDEAHEAHFLFGVDTTVPVNVDAAGGVRRPAVVFHLPIESSLVTTTQVEYTDKDGNKQTKYVYTIDYNKIPIYVTYKNDENGEAITVLQSEKGKVPQKFSCPNDTYWMKEFKNIKSGHPNFTKWVSGEITEESEAFITGSDTEGKNFDVLYADFGNPQSVSYDDEGTAHTFIPWKELWVNKENKTEDSNQDFDYYTVTRNYPKNVNADGTDNTDYSGYSTYSTNFKAQAPFIYEPVESNDDVTAYSSQLMPTIISGNYVNQEIVWSPNAKKVTLTFEGPGKYVLGTGYYADSSTVVISGKPNLGKKLNEWDDINNSNAFISSNNPYTIRYLTADINYKAVFVDDPNYVPTKYHVYFVSDPVGAGYIQNYQGQSDLGEYNEGTNPQFTALAYEGYEFDHWNNNNTNATIEITQINSNVTITAYFKQSQSTQE